ncbi:MAG: hypothetical protein ABI903_08860 [Actinomycetota bacterium]
MMGWYGDGMSPLRWVATGVFWVFLLALTVWLIARLLPGGSKTTRATGESSVELLNRKLAGGEIDLATWQAQRAALADPVAGSTDRPRGSS